LLILAVINIFDWIPSNASTARDNSHLFSGVLLPLSRCSHTKKWNPVILFQNTGIIGSTALLGDFNLAPGLCLAGIEDGKAYKNT
jgi:hypothetical protein